MEYVIVGLILGAFIGGVIFFIKKENKKLEEMISNLSDEQKNKLALTDVKFVEGKNDEWIQEGMIGEFYGIIKLYKMQLTINYNMEIHHYLKMM